MTGCLWERFPGRLDPANLSSIAWVLHPLCPRDDDPRAILRLENERETARRSWRGPLDPPRGQPACSQASGGHPAGIVREQVNQRRVPGRMRTAGFPLSNSFRTWCRGDRSLARRSDPTPQKPRKTAARVSPETMAPPGPVTTAPADSRGSRPFLQRFGTVLAVAGLLVVHLCAGRAQPGPGESDR